MSKMLTALVACVTLIPVLAEGSDQWSWEAELEKAAPCISESKPDLNRALECYDLDVMFCGSTEDRKTCSHNGIHELASLLPRYNKHKLGQALGMVWDPAKCEGSYGPEISQTKEDFLLLCRLTALLNQVTAGHIASIWGEFPIED